ncbi:MAG: Hsp33 family molecular chaperone HslO [Deltaproteobacteria bacterium]|nr:Hsp33 family molecular chaperone HslO [Deltaproteobacteria bacterium]
MGDYLVRIITRAGNIRAMACVTTGLVNEARKRHNTFPTASAALGRALTGGVLMGAMLKTGQKVALKFEGSGPLKKVIVEADSNGTVRGYVGVPDVYMVKEDGKLDVAGAVGKAGFLTVTKDIGLKEPYKGMVQLYTSEIAEDLAFYLTESEQIPSAVALGVYVEPDTSISAAGGFLIQTLPPQDNELIDLLINRAGKLPPVTKLLREGRTPEGILDLLFANIPYDILEKRTLAFQCSCSREKIERALISLGREELTSMIEGQEGAEVKCEFCRNNYSFTNGELENLLNNIS